MGKTKWELLNADRGDTYLCDWIATEEGYKLWLVDTPAISVVGKEFFDCEDSMCCEIISNFGDGEARLDYVRELPEEVFSSRLSGLKYYVMASGYGCYLKGLESYFEKGACEVCNECVEKRNESIIKLECEANGVDLIFIYRSNILILSERLINFFHPYNKGIYKIRQVDFMKKKRKKFYEILWNENKINDFDYVAISNEDVGFFHGWKCSGCQNGAIFYQDDRGLRYFASLSCLLKTMPDIFRLGRKKLCISEKLLRKATAELKQKKIRYEPLGVVPDDLLCLNPEMEVRIPAKKIPRLP